MPGAETEDHSPVRQLVDRGRIVRKGQRIADPAVDDVRTETECRRDGGRGGEGGERRRPGTGMVGDVEAVEPEILDVDREINQAAAPAPGSACTPNRIGRRAMLRR